MALGGDEKGLSPKKKRSITNGCLFLRVPFLDGLRKAKKKADAPILLGPIPTRRATHRGFRCRSAARLFHLPLRVSSLLVILGLTTC